jgi:arylamine N-acetyltransferase
MIDVGGYLPVLGVTRPAAPTAEELWALNRAQVERVAYETLDHQLGRPTGIGAAESVARILRGRGGYCFHLNGAFTAMVFAPEPVELSSFAAEHHWLSTSPESGFVRVVQAQLRDAKGVEMLRGCVLRRIDAEGTYERTLDSANDWYAVPADVFHLSLTDVDAPARAALWHRVHTAHQEGEAAGRPATTL